LKPDSTALTVHQEAVTVERNGAFARDELEAVFPMFNAVEWRPLDRPIAAWNWANIPDGLEVVVIKTFPEA
jgi:hypothetical protein